LTKIPLATPHKARRPSLFVAHPGHELYVLGWVLQERPLIHILTDGSGQTGHQRAVTSAHLIEKLHAKQGGLFAPFTDRELYQAMLDADIPLFLGILDTIVESILVNDTDFVVADAWEGFNPSHDILRFLVDEAIGLVRSHTGRSIPNFSIPLTAWESGKQVEYKAGDLNMVLSEADFQTKVREALSYEEMRGEVEGVLSTVSVEYFRTEHLTKVPENPHWFHATKPHYEKVGEQRVRDGVYSSCLRFEENLFPIMTEIRNYAGSAICSEKIRTFRH
jgi:hypothetical protein